MELPFAESYRIKMVEHIHRSTREEREQWINRDRGDERQTMGGHDAGR